MEATGDPGAGSQVFWPFLSPESVPVVSKLRDGTLVRIQQIPSTCPVQLCAWCCAGCKYA